jgi:hypothetical protein
MKDSLELIINDNRKHHHEHIPDRESGYKRDITICVYEESDLSSFDDRSKKLILHDE